MKRMYRLGFLQCVILCLSASLNLCEGSVRKEHNRGAKNAHHLFNLYLREEESKRLLGIDVALYYVRDGTMNDYALKFPVPVPGNMSQMEFTWQNLRPQQPLSYKIDTTTDNAAAMALPTLDIPLTGVMPSAAPSSFTVQLWCTGVNNAEVRLSINVNISSAGDKAPTNIKLLRKKVCFRDERSDAATRLAPVANEDEEEYEDEESLVPENGGSTGSPMVMDASTSSEPDGDDPMVLYAVAGATVMLAMAVMLATAVCYIRTKTLQTLTQQQGNVIIQAAADKYLQEWITASSTLQLKTPQSSRIYGNLSSNIDLSLTPSMAQKLIRVPGSPVASTIASYSPFRKASPPPLTPSPAPHGTHRSLVVNYSTGQYSTIYDTYSNSGNSVLSEQLVELAVSSHRLNIVKLLAEGTYGRMYQGQLNNGLLPDSGSQQVLIKTITDLATKDQKEVFMQEGMTMIGMDHANVLSLLGTCLDAANGQPILIFSYPNKIHLITFLRACNKFAKQTLDARCLTTQNHIDMAVQIAEGLAFLHRRFFLHKDIAARNCMVDDRLHVKLADNALARDFFSEDYHWLDDSNRDHEQERRPVKWLALESLQKREFTPASDLWMLGVTLWELLTLGQPPFPDIEPQKMATCLNSGYRLPQPANCPDELYNVMFRCWTTCPGERLTLPQMIRDLANLYNQLDNFV
ncbi:tyrosine-protein kinase RYK-like [Galendromus occidentalis]|uniref:Tyrosine-protein kinase RYK-like n=1 Tax=Galendromus occidentalis TaxID=34638 RepID=A0AAJ7WJF1_9ACAR|nr:tyrosine-protein kinase RYK-like [Galendromus occidentalis]